MVLARMESSRLPGKALIDLGGIPLIGMVLERFARHPELHPIVLATTPSVEDNLLAREAVSRGVEVYRGDSDDVLGRLIGAARRCGLGSDGAVVKATGDNPFVDAEEAVRAYREHCRADADLTIVEGLPMGAGVGVFKLGALERSWKESDDPVSREHPGLLVRTEPGSYRLRILKAPPEKNNPALRITIDEYEDLELARKIISRLEPGPVGPDLRSVINLLQQDDGFRAINRDVQQEKPVLCSQKT